MTRPEARAVSDSKCLLEMFKTADSAVKKSPIMERHHGALCEKENKTTRRSDMDLLENTNSRVAGNLTGETDADEGTNSTGTAPAVF